MAKKLITIMSNCFNEVLNVDDFYAEIARIMASQEERYDWEILFIDNSSVDGTVEKIKALAAQDSRVCAIVNARNFGQIRSPYYGVTQARGDAVISMATDFQDPPSILPQFIAKWEEGYTNVIGIKTGTKDNLIVGWTRSLFYNLIARVAETEQIKNFTGFGLYDKQFVDIMRRIDDPNPYFRGMITEFGLPFATVPYVQPPRRKGKTKNNFFTLYDLAMLGFVNHTRVPLRLVGFVGFVVSATSLLVAFGYLLYKIFAWDKLNVGVAPLVIGMFTLGGIQMLFLGIIGEYVGDILVRVRHRPLVIELERVNYAGGPGRESCAGVPVEAGSD